MISVKSRDVRKRIGLEKDMEHTELEEGEASYYQNDHESTIDPDVALSYIDDKIEDVLGQFQKAFEGGVSAENLGPKFGGYGSFLPTCPRSPAWSQQRIPSEVDDRNTPRSPKILEAEAFQPNLLASSVASLPVRPGAGFTASATVHASRAPCINGQVKREARIPFSSAEASTLKGESGQKSETSYKRRTLKVRIKVGKDNFPGRKNAEIYSGLGLDGSPSSSLGDSYTDSEGLSNDMRDASDESPTSILKVMKSFLLHGSRLLSPLPDEFVQLTENEKYRTESVSKVLHKGKVNECDFEKYSRKLLLEREPNAYEEGDFAEAVNGNASLILKRETDLESVACDKLVYNTLKLPLLSNMQSGAPGPAEGTVTAAGLSYYTVKGSTRDRSSSYVKEEQLFKPGSVQESGRIQKSNGNFFSSSRNISISTKANSVDNYTVPKNPGKHRGPRNNVSVKMDSGVPEQGRALSGEIDVQTDCFLNKRNKGSHANSLLPFKSDYEDIRKDNKNKDKFREFFGDLEFEQDGHGGATKEVSSVEKLTDSGLVQNGSTLDNVWIKKEKSSVRKTEKASTSEEYSRVSSIDKDNFALRGLRLDATKSVPNHMNDHWVQCEKCKSRRLLPLGKNPGSLPEKWACTMLDWLPAMNRCSISEEETTQAVRYNNQLPAPAAPPRTECKPPDHHGYYLSVESSAAAFNSADGHQMIGEQASFTGGKKLNSKDDPDRYLGVEPAHVPKSLKNCHAKSNSLNIVNHSSLVDEYDYQQSSSSIAEKHAIKPTKKRSVESYSAAGDPRNLKVRKRGQSDFGSSISAKKAESEDAYHNGETCPSSPSGDSLTLEHCLYINSPYNMPRKDRRKSDRHPKDLKSEIPDHISATEIISSDASLPIHKSEGKSSFKKRKGQGDQDAHTYTGHLPSAEYHFQDSCENSERKEKKVRTSKSEGKDTTTRKSSNGADKRAREMDQPMGQDQGSSRTTESLKRDPGSEHPSAAATSSSSKESGSCKVKSGFQEVKGSPVKSVSSSPKRVSSADKYTLTSTNPQGKEGTRDDSFLGNISPRRLSDGECNGGNDWFGILKGDAAHKVNRHRSTESFVVNQQDTDLSLELGGKIEEGNRSSSDCANNQPINDDGTQGNQSTCKSQVSEKYHDERRKGDHNCIGGSQLRKLENGSSSQSNNGKRTSISEIDKVQIRAPDSMNEVLDVTPWRDTKLIDERNKFQEIFCPSSDKDEKSLIAEKGSGGEELIESSKSENQSKFGVNDGLYNKVNEMIKQNVKGNVVLGNDDEKESRKLLPEKAGTVEVSGRGKSHSLPPSARYKNEKGASQQLISGPHKENEAHMLVGDAQDDDTLKAPKQNKKLDKQSENHLTPTALKAREHDGAPIRKDSSSHAANSAVKEAKYLKHLADRLKHSGSNESTAMYFQAALKFLSGASLLESGSCENNEHNEIQSTQIYSSTAKLCEFCAHEYERSKDMAAAALAYKCMEVAYMRVIYSSHGHSSRDRYELQMALQIVPSGESPSSSASDVDNLNNLATLDKVSSTKGVGSPQVAGIHGITAINRSSYMRLLNYAQDVSFAMEAARKSRSAFAVANLKSSEAHCGDGISSVKRALDFNYQDTDGLLRLVRIAMDAISH